MVLSGSKFFGGAAAAVAAGGTLPGSDEGFSLRTSEAACLWFGSAASTRSSSSIAARRSASLPFERRSASRSMYSSERFLACSV